MIIYFAMHKICTGIYDEILIKNELLQTSKVEQAADLTLVWSVFNNK